MNHNHPLLHDWCTSQSTSGPVVVMPRRFSGFQFSRFEQTTETRILRWLYQKYNSQSFSQNFHHQQKYSFNFQPPVSAVRNAVVPTMKAAWAVAQGCKE